MQFKRQKDGEVSVNLTPLIDVVFLLLIFFMVSTTFTKETHRDREKNISVPNFFSVGYLQMVCKAISFLARYIWKKKFTYE